MTTHDLIDHPTWRGAAETSMPLVVIMLAVAVRLSREVSLR
ncbi:hypothetical protein [Nocardioides gansuensis]|nr:hypothetical protein [Nocardioides gansuensis]